MKLHSGHHWERQMQSGGKGKCSLPMVKVTPLLHVCHASESDLLSEGFPNDLKRSSCRPFTFDIGSPLTPGPHSFRLRGCVMVEVFIPSSKALCILVMLATVCTCLATHSGDCPKRNQQFCELNCYIRTLPTVFLSVLQHLFQCKYAVHSLIWQRTLCHQCGMHVWRCKGKVGMDRLQQSGGGGQGMGPGDWFQHWNSTGDRDRALL